MNKLKYKISLMVIIFIVVSCVLLTYISIRQNTKAVNSITSGELKCIAQQAADKIALNTEKNWSELAALASNPQIADPDISIGNKSITLASFENVNDAEDVNFTDASGNIYVQEAGIVNISESTYFIEAMKGNNAVSEPVDSLSNDGTKVIIYAVPVVWKDKVVGVIIETRTAAAMSEITKEITFGKTGTAYVINSGGTVVASNDESKVNKEYNIQTQVKKDSSLSSQAKAEKEMIKSSKDGLTSFTIGNKDKLAGYSKVKNTGWTVCVTIDESDAYSGITSATKFVGIASFIIIFIAIVVTIILTGFFISPINIATDELICMANGDFSRQIPDKILLKKDETGKLAGAMQRMQFSISGAIREVLKETSIVNDNVNNQQEKVTALLGDIEGISATTQELSAGAEETAASTEEMTATAENIGESVAHVANKADKGIDTAKQITDRAEAMKKNAIEAVDKATSVYSTTQTTLKQALEDAKAAEKITTLSNTILGIAEETNLLALNASIEAARAGEAGKGFSVVAGQINKLAESSKNSAAQIQSVTNEVITSVDNLSNCASDLLKFLDETVNHDYDSMVKTGEQYSKDADEINGLVVDFKNTTVKLKEMIDALITTIDEVATANDESAKGTTAIADNASGIAESANRIVEYANETIECTTKLEQSVNIFKL